MWWTIGTDTGFVHCQGGPYVDGYQHEKCCLPQESNYTLTCQDTYGDGWDSGWIIVNGINYCGNTFEATFQPNPIWFSSSSAVQVGAAGTI
eukprot:UN30447